MRNFAYVNPDFIKNEVVPELVEDNPCYQQSVYDSVMYDESPDGDLIQVDMTQILLNQEKYRRLLGDMNVQNILAQMYPTQSTVMDGMTDEERFNCIISRHCQTMSERQAVLQQLANEKSELSAYAESMLEEQLAEKKAEPSPDPAPAPES
jgi:pyoverdine/dityrosine biosynthesis protein Dit1